MPGKVRVQEGAVGEAKVGVGAKAVVFGRLGQAEPAWGPRPQMEQRKAEG